MSHEQATVAEEEYLQIIFWLQEAGLPMTGANVARAMQVSAPTVHEMIGRLESDGYITRRPDKSLEFTETGRQHAEDIVRIVREELHVTATVRRLPAAVARWLRDSALTQDALISNMEYVLSSADGGPRSTAASAP